MRKTGAVRLIASLAAGVLMLGASAKRNLGAPVAMDRAGDSTIYVLSADRNIRRFEISGQGFSQSGEFPVDGFPIDFTYSQSDQVESLFVCSTLAGKGAISRYATDGKLMGRWWLWHPCGGVDFDQNEHALYVGAADTGEIYRIDVRSQAGAVSIGELPHMEKMGPIALDAAGKKLYVGDVAGGVVFEFDILAKVGRKLIWGLGGVAGLYFDPRSQSLYIADTVAKSILVAKIGPASSPQRVVSNQAPSKTRKQTSASLPTEVVVRDPAFRAPSGVLPVGEGRYAVSDYSANALFLVASDRTIASHFP